MGSMQCTRKIPEGVRTMKVLYHAFAFVLIGVASTRIYGVLLEGDNYFDAFVSCMLVAIWIKVFIDRRE